MSRMHLPWRQGLRPAFLHRPLPAGPRPGPLAWSRPLRLRERTLSDIEIRRASEANLPTIVALLSDDDLGSSRETPGDLEPYRKAFESIDADPSEFLAVAERDGEVIGTLQLSVIPGL